MSFPVQEYIMIFTLFLVIDVNVTEEPYEGKPHVRFCEGHALPHILTIWR